MLTNLHVKNMALIDEAEMEFGQGLNILTGETGAGKSLLMGSVNLALGKKASRDMIREGEDSALVELVFQVEDPLILSELHEMDADPEDGMFIISRKIKDGRSISRLNGETCTAARIRQIASLLLDIHGQHEHQSLLYPDRQLQILDAFGRDVYEEDLLQTEETYRKWQTLLNEQKKYSMNEEEQARETAFLEFEIKEIREAALTPGEEETLESSYRRMQNGRKIMEALQSVYQLGGNDGGAGELVGRALQELSSVSSYDTPLEEMEKLLLDVEGILADFNHEVSSYMDRFTFSDEEFYETEQRLDLIHHLESKYGRTVQDVLSALEKKEMRLQELAHYEEMRQRLAEETANAEAVMKNAAAELSAKRHLIGQNLSEKIVEGLKELNFPEVHFEIAFTKAAYRADGCDDISFLISANPGEPLRELAKIASGGELSRIMLAIKTILAEKDHTETLIFDEIDTGISGRTAQLVSEKMARIGRHHQVICITHLAQIAAMADRHFEIYKEAEDNSTVTRIRPLEGEASEEELARILGGAEITQAVRDNAREMKTLATKKKKRIRDASSV